MTKNEIRTILAAQTDERTRAYEVEITKCAVMHKAAELETILTEIMNNDSDEMVRYNGFVCLCTVYRSHRDYEKLMKFLEANG